MDTQEIDELMRQVSVIFEPLRSDLRSLAEQVASIGARLDRIASRTESPRKGETLEWIVS